MLDITALEQALGHIEEAGQGEITFTVNGMDVTIRVMTPDEEVAVQRYAQEVLPDPTPTPQEGGQEARVNKDVAMEYLDRFKQEVAAYTIVRVGDLDLRDVRVVSTGKMVDGRPESVQKHVAVRNLVKKWPRPTLDATFRKYGELLERVEAQAEKIIQFDPVDLKAEIERVESRLADLKQELARLEGAQGSSSPVKDALQATELQNASQRAVRNAAVGAPADDTLPPEVEPTPAQRAEPAPEPPPRPPQATRERTMPIRAAPPPRPATRPAAPSVAESEPDPEAVSNHPDISGSFGDDDDAVAAEHERLMARRRQMLEARKARQEAHLPSVKRREPPHRQAANTMQAVVDTTDGDFSRAQKVGQIDGKDAFALPTQTLDRRGPPKAKPTAEDFQSKPQSVNPRFRPPRG